MKYVLMNLEGDRMSFGYNSNSGMRYTTEFPTKSALFGMICCAMGRNGVLTELFDRLRQMDVEVFAITKGRIETDFQTIGTGWREAGIKFIDKNPSSSVKMDVGDFMTEFTCENKKKTETYTSIVDKDYLVNQRFMVLLGIEDDTLAGEIADSLQRPVWQMYIGRKKCVPCGRVLQGIFDSKEEAMAIVDGLNPLYVFTEEEPDDYIDEMNVRDVPTTEFGKYDTYTHRRVYKSEYARA